MNQPDSDIDREWSVVAHQRLNDLRSGKLRGVPGEELNQSQNGDTCFHLNGILEKQDKI